MDDKAIVIFKKKNDDKGIDIEIPLNITANELIYGLNKALELGIDMEAPEEAYFRMENPIGLIRGDVLLREYGIRNGSILYNSMQR